jgi:hypothetical protein
MSAGADRWIRWTTVACLGLLALIAGTVSYLHMHALVTRHGQPGWVAALTPISVDGMIVAGSTTLLADSRSGRAGPSGRTWLLRRSVGQVLADVAASPHGLAPYRCRGMIESCGFCGARCRSEAGAPDGVARINVARRCSAEPENLATARAASPVARMRVPHIAPSPRASRTMSTAGEAASPIPLVSWNLARARPSRCGGVVAAISAVALPVYMISPAV